MAHTNPLLQDEVLKQAAEAEAVAAEAAAEEVAEVVEEAPVAVEAKAPKTRSQRYQAARGQVDRTISYPVDQAIEMVKKTSYSKFEGTITAHLNLAPKREFKNVEVAMPHSTGKDIVVAIANEEVLENLQSGVINFDVLLATPETMPKLAKYARLLGPRGLMPNPRNGTVTSDPETKKASLQGGTVSVKAEKSAPLMHVRVGKTKQATEQVAGNIEALLKALGPGAVVKLTLSATMSPGVKVQL